MNILPNNNINNNFNIKTTNYDWANKNDTNNRDSINYRAVNRYRLDFAGQCLNLGLR